MNMPAAFAKIALAVSAKVGGPYVAANLITSTITQDEGGDTTKVDGPPRGCSVQVDVVTDAMRQAVGFTERDVRILVLAASLSGGVTTDDRVEVQAGPHAGTFQIASINRDPAGVYWELRGQRG